MFVRSGQKFRGRLSPSSKGQTSAARIRIPASNLFIEAQS